VFKSTTSTPEEPTSPSITVFSQAESLSPGGKRKFREPSGNCNHSVKPCTKTRSVVSTSSYLPFLDYPRAPEKKQTIAFTRSLSIVPSTSYHQISRDHFPSFPLLRITSHRSLYFVSPNFTRSLSIFPSTSYHQPPLLTPPVWLVSMRWIERERLEVLLRPVIEVGGSTETVRERSCLTAWSSPLSSQTRLFNSSEKQIQK
jgi:hypothetical protein